MLLCAYQDLFSEVPTLLATQSEKGMKIFHQESVVTGGSTAAPSVRDQDGTIPEQAHSRPQFDSVLSTEIEGSTEAKVPYRADGGQGDQRVDDEAWVHFYTQVYDPDMRGAPLSEAWRHGVKFWDLSSHPTYSYVHPHEGHKGFRPIGDDGGFGYLKLRNVSSSSESTDLPSPLSLLSQSTQTISLPSSAQHVDGKVDVTRKTERSKRRAQRGTRKVAIPMAGPGETGRVPFEPLLPALDVSLISSRSLIVTQPQKETALSHLGVDGQEESKDLSFPLTPIGEPTRPSSTPRIRWHKVFLLYCVNLERLDLEQLSKHSNDTCERQDHSCPPLYSIRRFC